ncbi:hypothetical protein [Sporosarcina sp. D27]|uniref:hypothetical protein n=1 Tax=Sporosarcina sp. D27 TaxID=1382305 RepID=UPI00046FD760|nr:hypothetical protein [Sporosarcina sp. D27]
MDKKLGLVLGSLFILTSGLIYTMERLIAYVYLFAQINTGTWDTVPQTMPLLKNLFIGAFFIIGIIFIFMSFKKENH